MPTHLLSGGVGSSLRLQGSVDGTSIANLEVRVIPAPAGGV